MLILERNEISISRGTLAEVAGETMPHFILVGQLCKGEED